MISAHLHDVSDASWRGIRELLTRGPTPLLSERQRGDALQDWEEVARLESHLEDALVIALIGGTGVGKSTLINALAGAEISRSSDRRPTTDRVVVYVHRNTEIPLELPLTDFAVPYGVHTRDRLAKVVLLDFPDFDSDERSHAEILGRHLPHLDVLLVLADDMKYGDLRLYELLKSLDQAATNVFPILNKVDRLAGRYGDRSASVAAEMMTDFRHKLEIHAGLAIPESQCFVIAAREVLLERLGTPPEGSPGAQLLENVGTFPDLEGLLESYQESKRRRLAKENNLDAHKASLREQLRKTALSAENQDMRVRLRSMTQSAEHELMGVLAGTAPQVFGERERTRWRQSQLRQAAQRWGPPCGLLLTLLAEWGRLRRKSDLAPGDILVRATRHYRGFLEAARNLQLRLDLDLAEVEAPVPSGDMVSKSPVGRSPSPVTSDWLQPAAESLRQISESQVTASSWRRWLTHLPAALTFLAVAGSTLWTSETSSFAEASTWARAALKLVNPMTWLGLLFAVLLAYGLTSVVIWLLEIQSLDGKIAAAERAIRQAAEAHGQRVLGDLTRRVSEVEQEFRTFERLLA